MKHFLFIYTLFIATIAFAQPPQWVDPAYRGMQYSSKDYLVGYSEDLNTKNDDNVEDLLIFLREDAKTQLINTVKVKVKSVATLEQVDVGGKKGSAELFRQYSSSFSELELKGLTVDSYYDKRKKKAYGFAYAKRSDVIDNYNGKANQAIKDIEASIEKGDNQKNAGRTEDALKSYMECNAFFRVAEEALSIMFVLQRVGDSSIEKTSESLKSLKLQQDERLGAIQNNKDMDIGEAALLLATAYASQNDIIKEPIRLGNISFKDTEMGSAFSRRFYSSFEQKLATNTTLDIRTSVPPGSNYNQLLTGTYWEDGDYLKIITSIRNTATGKTIYSAESKVSKAKLSALGINYKPENFAEAHSKMLQFKKDDIIGGGLNLEVWTSKGQDNLMFTGGERMKLYIRVNQECYVRFVYHMADGSQVMLLDNYYVGTNAVNKVYEIPYEFECAEPYGVEILQVNAQNKEFEALNTVNQYGYDFIVDDLSSVLVKTRGFKRVETIKPIKTETRMTITTYAPSF